MPAHDLNPSEELRPRNTLGVILLALFFLGLLAGLYYSMESKVSSLEKRIEKLESGE